MVEKSGQLRFDQDSFLFPMERARDVPAEPRLHLRLHIWALLVALFLFATQAAFLAAGDGGAVAGASNAASNPGPLHIAELALTFVITVPMILSRWRAVADAAMRMGFLVASCVLALLSVFWSQYPSLTFRSALYLILNTAFALYMAKRFRGDQLMQIFMLLGVVSLVVSLAAAFALPDYAWTMAGGLPAFRGVFIAKNDLGLIAVFLLSPVFYVKGISRGMRLAYAVALTALVISSVSIQAWIAALVSVVFWLVSVLFRRLPHKETVWIGFISVIPLIGAGGILIGYWLELLLLFGKDPTLSGRTTIWSAVLVSIAKRPLLGWGYDAVWRGFEGESANMALLIHFPIAQAQNGFLEILLELGAVGLASVVGIFGQAFWNLRSCLRRGPSGSDLWCMLVLFLTFFYSLGEIAFLVQNYLPWIMCMIACTHLAIRSRGTAWNLRERICIDSLASETRSL